MRLSTEAYRQHYQWGWRYSQRPSATLDYVDDRYRRSTTAEEHADYNAALDGYLDYAAGRPKWHMLNCPDHNNC